ncbi:hypothetical protein AJ79_09698 [Helicocarpus griseus UAMH5409]|uniref:Uncharacterized protein n=1 Tax=Helicocarpus griseus UAMH5409 TaxID=1447875 RepID=A0A2B7WI07_9EURO|nr:hypothetical protein AJ79_09698 [Helicocarpus griseus UAMH5409]
MFRAKSTDIPIPPKNPRRNASTAGCGSANEFELDSVLHELKPARLEPKVYSQDSTAPISPKNSAVSPTCTPTYTNGEEFADVPITYLDHTIARHGGRTASIDRLPGVMNREKATSTSPQDKLLDLTRENGRLRAELAYHQKTRKVLMELYARIVEVYKTSSTTMEKLNNAVQCSSQGLAVAERDLLRYWGISIDPDTERNQPGQSF